ncbi:MAG: hypothetical protein IIZ19_02540, partial [Clostridia bacterium]|nr:hypothetical protein [Clostridia bacterium]
PAAVTGDAVYTARFRQSVNAYTVTWQNEDGTEIASGEVEYGTVPEYTGDTPVKAETAEYIYIFSGWTPEITAVTGAAAYTAVFTQEKKAPKYAVQITDASIVGATEQQPIPAGKLTVEVSLRLAETTEPEAVRVIIVSYTEDGRFIGYYPGTLKKEADGAYTVNADIQNSGDIGYMRIMALSSDGWIPLAEAVELK